MGRGLSRSGFTLIELMLVLLVTAIVFSQILALLGSQHSTYVGQERALEAQEHARLVADMVVSEVRMAGLMVPQKVGIASLDGGSGGPDALCISDPAILSEASLASATSRFDRASLLAAVGAGAASAQLVASQLDIDGDGTGDFAVGRGVILGNGSSTHCARITGISGSTLSFSPVTPAGFNLAVAGARAVPALIYEAGSSGLLRNGGVLSRQVEDLQVEFGVDANGDAELGPGEFPIHTLAGFDPSRVRSVRISVTTRTLAADPDLVGAGRAAAANRSAGSPDGLRRRRIITSAVPRNLI